HSNERIPQLLNLGVPRVIELTRARTLGPAVTQFLRSLEGDFQVAFAFGVEKLVALGDLECALGEFCAHLDVAIEIGRLNEPRALSGGGRTPLGMKMTAAIAMELERPLRGRETWIGEIDP